MGRLWNQAAGVYQDNVRHGEEQSIEVGFEEGVRRDGRPVEQRLKPGVLQQSVNHLLVHIDLKTTFRAVVVQFLDPYCAY